MRQYQRIWESIKNSPSHKASLIANPSIHKRIIKAVKKEKSIDVGWKLLLSEEGKRYKLSIIVKDNVIIFALKDNSPITTHSL